MSFEFEKLESLRLLCSRIQQDQDASLRHFEYDGGYQHYGGKNKISVSSTGTCILLLTATGKWDPDPNKTRKLIHYLVSRKTSAGLPRDNAYSFAWILETVTALEKYSPVEQRDLALVEKMERVLQSTVKKGSVRIASYPQSAYLTQLVVRILLKRSKLTKTLRHAVQEWAWKELPHQLAMVQAKSKSSDPFELAYLLMLHTVLTPKPERTPEQTSTYQTALKTLFDCQLEDGSWPLSRPLFQHPNYGIAYCYEYEMLTQLLQHSELQDFLLDHLPKLQPAAELASRNSYKLDNGVQVWSSGNFLQGKPESWASASVYHFFFELHRLLAEAVRRELFQYLDLPLPPASPQTVKNAKKTFAPRFLDSRVKVRGSTRPLKHFLWKNFVEPLANETKTVGGVDKFTKFKKGTPISAIFFGPPGTSKTELSQQIADFLGWPLLAIDPSHLLRSGMDGIQAEANYIFRRLEETERIVVLFDEFDEFVRERGSSDAEQFSRLLTTAMLPKLASIHERATLVFIIATNNIRQFDLAIRRPGRFDRVVQIMPPIFEEKMEKETWGVAENIDVGKTLRQLGVKIDKQARKHLGDLTFLEFDAFATDLAKAQDAQEALRVLHYHWERCVLQSVDKDDKTWKQRCIEEERFNR
jgi:hypothetical protein